MIVGVQNGRITLWEEGTPGPVPYMSEPAAIEALAQYMFTHGQRAYMMSPECDIPNQSGFMDIDEERFRSRVQDRLRELLKRRH